MLDTVKFSIKEKGLKGAGFVIPDYSYFNTTEKAIFSNPMGYYAYPNKLTKRKKTNPTDLANVLLIKQGNELSLTVEFSAPKIIYGENVSELSLHQQEEVVNAIKIKLADNGVLTTCEAIKESMVLAFHPSKNIILKEIPPKYVIKALAKADVNKKYQSFGVRYENDGSSQNIYSKKFSLVVYDKNKELIKSSPASSTITKKVNKNIPPNILRIEARLCDRKHVMSAINSVGFANPGRFCDIFNPALCQMIVIKYWETFYKNKAYLFTSPVTTQEMAKRILTDKPRITKQKLLRMIGEHALMADPDGPVGFKTIITERYENHAWHKMQKEIKELNNLTDYRHGVFDEIDRQLDQFTPLTLSVV